MNTTDRIQQVDIWLRANRPDYYALLRPPETDASLNDVESHLSVRLPDEFRLLYKWHGGQTPREFTPLVFNLTFMTLPEVVEMKTTLDQVAAYDQWDADHWRPDWIPFLDNGGGDLLCFDLGGYGTGVRNQMLWFDHESDKPDIMYESLDAFLADLYDRMLNNNLRIK